jgi:transposase InsO family protein
MAIEGSERLHITQAVRHGDGELDLGLADIHQALTSIPSTIQIAGTPVGGQHPQAIKLKDGAGSKEKAPDIIRWRMLWEKHHRPGKEAQARLKETATQILALQPRFIFASCEQPETTQLSKPTEQLFLDAGYQLEVRSFNPATLGANTSGYLYALVAAKDLGEFEWPEENTSFEGLEKLLADPKTVSPSLRAECSTNKKNQEELIEQTFTPLQVGSLTRGGEEIQCFSPSHPLPPFTEKYSGFSGTNGAAWVYDEMGARKITIADQRNLSGYSVKLKTILGYWNHELQQLWIANTTPVAPVSKIYDRIVRCLDNQTNLHHEPPATSDMGESPADPWIVGYVCAHIMPGINEIQTEQDKDPVIGPIKRYLQSGREAKKKPADSQYTRFLDYLRVDGGTVYLREEIGDDKMTDAILLPASMKERTLQALHDSPHAGHAGLKATLAAVRDRVFWAPRMIREIKDYIKNCAACKRAKAHRRMNAGHMQFQLYHEPFERVGIDLVGPLTRSSDGNKYILHVCDLYSGFNIVEPIPDKEAETVAKALHQQIILRFGTPLEIVSDRGSEFLNKVFESLTEQCGIHHLATTSYHPEGNAATERGHRFFNSVLKIARNIHGQPWDESIYYAAATLNSMPVAGTTYSPYELLFGRKPRGPADAMLLADRKKQAAKQDMSVDEYFRQITARQDDMREAVNQAKLQQIRRNRFQNQKLKYTVEYHAGDLVLLYRSIRKKGITQKLLFQTTGPFEVVAKVHDNVYRLRKLSTGTESKHNVRDICPYITKEQHERKEADGAAAAQAMQAEPAEPDQLDPKAGDFLIFPGTAPSQSRLADNYTANPEKFPFFLCEVKSVEPAEGTVHIHYYNTYSQAQPPRLRGYLPAWAHTSTGVEQFKQKCPKNHQPVEDPGIPLEEFCPVKINPVRDQKGILSLRGKEIERALRLRPQG